MIKHLRKLGHNMLAVRCDHKGRSSNRFGFFVLHKYPAIYNNGIQENTLYTVFKDHKTMKISLGLTIVYRYAGLNKTK